MLQYTNARGKAFARQYCRWRYQQIGGGFADAALSCWDKETREDGKSARRQAKSLRAQAGLLLGERENGEQSVLCASPSAQGVFSAVFIRINGSLFIDIFAAVWNLSSHVWRILAQPCRGGARGAAWERDDAVCLRQGRFGRARPVLVGKAKFSPRVSVPVSGARRTEYRVFCRFPATQARRRLSALPTQANRNKAHLPPARGAGARHS